MIMLKNQHKVLLLKLAIHLLSLAFLVQQYYLAINDQLGGDPVKAIIHFTGIGALHLLMLTLLVTPLTKKFKLPWLMQVRRLVGLYAFTYALCHVLSFLFFELQFDWSLFIAEIVKRPYITVGMVAFVILVALAITSLKVLQRKMGRHWQKLHNFIYLAIILAGIHFYWSVKSEIIEPSIYLILIFLLLSFRQQKLRKLFN